MWQLKISLWKFSASRTFIALQSVLALIEEVATTAALCEPRYQWKNMYASKI